jgi:segregation and condensation protein A
VLEPALAKLYGRPLLEVPNDLYIPPDALTVFLDAFEGPLDLLLYLIRRQNFDIMDIPMAALTQQYLRYVEEIRNHNLELAGEYLLMAAMLIEIKSRMLLPVIPKDDGGEPEDPRAELVRRLLEYEQIKAAARVLDEQPQIERDFWPARALFDPGRAKKLPEVQWADLQNAWQDILHRARLTTHHVIGREALSVREHMTLILRRLQDRRFLEFRDLFETGSPVPIVVVHFIAMLELTREGLLEITQAVAYAPIYVRLGYRPIA